MEDVKLQENQKLFLDNAFLFFKHKDRILADARMYSCQVPFKSGFGFLRPTLRTYLYWWHTHENALILKEDESEWLVYFITGNPMTGSNKCEIVNKDGDKDWKQIIPFAAVHTSFSAAKLQGKASDYADNTYTLREIVDILKNDESGLDDNEVHIIFLRNELKKQAKWLNHEMDYLREDIGKLKNRLMICLRKELAVFMEEYNMIRGKILACEKEIADSIYELRRQLKAGEIDSKQYQRQLTPLKKEKEKVKDKLDSLYHNLADIIFPDCNFTIKSIEEFLKRK